MSLDFSLLLQVLWKPFFTVESYIDPCKAVLKIEQKNRAIIMRKRRARIGGMFNINQHGRLYSNGKSIILPEPDKVILEPVRFDSFDLWWNKSLVETLIQWQLYNGRFLSTKFSANFRSIFLCKSLQSNQLKQSHTPNSVAHLCVFVRHSSSFIRRIWWAK